MNKTILYDTGIKSKDYVEQNTLFIKVYPNEVSKTISTIEWVARIERNMINSKSVTPMFFNVKKKRLQIGNLRDKYMAISQIWGRFKIGVEANQYTQWKTPILNHIGRKVTLASVLKILEKIVTEELI